MPTGADNRPASGLDLAPAAPSGANRDGGRAIEPLLTVDDTAALLQVSQRHVRRLIASGELPVVRIGKAVRLLPQAVRRFIGG